MTKTLEMVIIWVLFILLAFTTLVCITERQYSRDLESILIKQEEKPPKKAFPIQWIEPQDVR